MISSQILAFSQFIVLSSLRGWSSCDLPFISIYNSWSGSLWCGWCLGGGHGRGLDDGLHDGEEQPDRGRGGQAAVVAACIYQSYRPLLPLLHHRLLDDLPRLPDEPDFWFVQQVDLSLRSFPLTLRRSRHFSFLALVFSFSFSYRGGEGRKDSSGIFQRRFQNILSTNLWVLFQDSSGVVLRSLWLFLDFEGLFWGRLGFL